MLEAYKTSEGLVVLGGGNQTRVVMRIGGLRITCAITAVQLPYYISQRASCEYPYIRKYRYAKNA